MKIAVMGAGAVGCYFGGMLARAGHEVALVGRAANVEAIRRQGLLMQTTAFSERVRLNADTAPAAVRDAELVLFCVKSGDTESAGAALRPFLSAGCTLLSVQNGVDNAARLQTAIGRPVVPSVVYVAVDMPQAGHLLHRGRGELVLPDGEDGQRLSALLRPAGIPVQLSGNVAGAQWAKLIVNCAFNALSAIAQKPFGPLRAAASVEALMDEIVDECLAVARAAGIEVPGDPREALRRTGSQSAQTSSMAQDLARGRRTEIEHLNGYVVRQAELLGVPVPVNRCLQVIVGLIEPPTPDAIDRDQAEAPGNG